MLFSLDVYMIKIICVREERREGGREIGREEGRKGGKKGGRGREGERRE